jgi:protein O-mannosyl-transferase
MKQVIKKQKKNNSFPVAILPVILAIVLYLNTVPNKYCLDDALVILDNTYVKAGLSGIPDLLTTNYLNGDNHFNDGSYRPLPMITYAVEYSLFGLNPNARHFVNMILYALLGYFIFMLMKRLLPGSHIILPLSISLLYIAHPIHTEVVANIKGRDDLMGLLFAVMAMYYILRYCTDERKILLFAGLSFFLLSLSCKESSVMFMFIIPIMLLIFNRASGKKFFRIVIPVVLITMLWLLLRYLIVNSMSTPVDKGIVAGFNNSVLSTDNMFSRFATGLSIQLLYIQHLIFPVTLSHDYSYNQIPVIPMASSKAILSLLLIIGLFIIGFLLIRKRRAISFGIFYYFITIAVYANIFIYIGATFANRFLFSSSLGFAIIEGVLLYKLAVKPAKENLKKQDIISFIKENKVYPVMLLVILCLYSVKTISRNTDWKDNFALFSADVSHSPNSARIHFDLATELLNLAGTESSEMKKKEYLTKAVTEFNKAIRISPGYLDAMHNLGAVYQKLGKPDSAIITYAEIVRIDSTFRKSDFALGLLYYNSGRYREAIHMMKSVLVYHPEYENVYVVLGSSYESLGNFPEGIRYLEKCLAVNPNNKDARYLLGRGYEAMIKAYESIGDRQQAAYYQQKLAELNPPRH